MIAIVDYGAGNIASVLKAFRACGAAPRVVRTASEMGTASAIVVPGVGHFRATSAIDDRWRGEIVAAVNRGTPLLGICLGMQWLYDGSEEAPDLRGLGMIQGRVARMTGDVKVPHVGWNTLRRTDQSRVVDATDDGVAVYFTHSFAAPVTAETTATTEHGGTFAAVVERRNVTGMQFHPEKSGAAGLRLLTRWLALVERGADAV